MFKNVALLPLLMVLYNDVVKRFSLPSWDDLDKFFDLDGIKDDEKSLREARKSVSERVHFVVTILEHILMPDPNSYVELYECRCVEDGDKDRLLDVFKKFMILDRKLLIGSLSSSDDIDASLVREGFSVYKEQISSVLKYLVKVQKSWSDISDIKEVLGYLG